MREVWYERVSKLHCMVLCLMMRRHPISPLCPYSTLFRSDTEAVIDAFEYVEYEPLGATVRMARGQGHQAITGTAYGLYAYDPERGPTVTDVIRYPAACVNPPDGMTSVAWIEAGMPGADCP